MSVFNNIIKGWLLVFFPRVCNVSNTYILDLYAFLQIYVYIFLDELCDIYYYCQLYRPKIFWDEEWIEKARTIHFSYRDFASFFLSLFRFFLLYFQVSHSIRFGWFLSYIYFSYWHFTIILYICDKAFLHAQFLNGQFLEAYIVQFRFFFFSFFSPLVSLTWKQEVGRGAIVMSMESLNLS